MPPHLRKRHMTNKFISKLKSFFSVQQENPIENPEEMRHDFKERYFYFKQLLKANNGALEGFAEIERLLNSSQTFGMSSVKATSTAVLVNVLRMIRKLGKLAPEKYTALNDRFNAIEADINAVLQKNKRSDDDRLVIKLSEIDRTMADDVGQKMANLGEMKNVLALNVPDGFVITAHAYTEFFKQNNLFTDINRKFKTVFSTDIEQMHACSNEIQSLIRQAEIPDEIKKEITDALAPIQENFPDVRLALRSSAIGEDTLEASFAGQYKTLLNVRVEDVCQAYKEILASKYGVTAIQYRLNRGFKDEDIDMCVGALAMVDASSGGVAYTHHPFDGHNDGIHIQSTWGLPKAVVDGTVNCDLFVVSRGSQFEVSHRDIQEKDKKFICYADESECRLDFIDDMQSQPSLTEDQVLAIAQQSVKIESHYGRPQDIEWAVLDDDPASEPYFLQCRPMTHLRKKDYRSLFPEVKEDDSLLASGGLTASPGAASGNIFIATDDGDLTRFPENGVLVTQLALPKWAPLLGRAAAVITEKGGFAGHLANVAREFGIPAIFGITDACTLLTPETEVTVDADNLKVYQGKIRDILVSQPKKKNLMEGSPVYNTLEQVSRLIIPLNLLDPDANEFKASNCQTLHDITRFIHEKSVTEMFNFGKNKGFDEVASKQLHDKIPMAWWVMNLDDGFNKEVKGKYVYLEDIVSVPMLAAWEGIVAVPWDGPPPVDRRGMMSVMFQATANTALNTGVRTKYSQRNYFMISKQYCCLNSRLGFHFTTLESFVGDRESENYISFRFQGGAADKTRRLKRVQFIGKILSGYGFKVIIKEDHLNARLKGQEKDYMIDRLKIIGYLSIHTRQLDMVTANQALINKYYSKFTSDIESAFNVQIKKDAGPVMEEVT